MRNQAYTFLLAVLSCLVLFTPGCKSPLDVDTPLKTLGRIYPATVTISSWGDTDTNGVKVDAASIAEMTNQLAAIIELDTLSNPGCIWIAMQLKTNTSSSNTHSAVLGTIRLSTDSLVADGLWRELVGTHAQMTLVVPSASAGNGSISFQADGSKYVLHVRCFHVRERRSFTIGIEGSYIAIEGTKPTGFDGEIILTY